MKGAIIAFAGAAAMALALGAGRALADDYDTLRSECAKQLQLSPSGCDCIADSARDELTDEERSLVVAHVTRQQDQIASLQHDMSGESVMKAVTFMSTTPQKCSGQ